MKCCKHEECLVSLVDHWRQLFCHPAGLKPLMGTQVSFGQKLYHWFYFGIADEPRVRPQEGQSLGIYPVPSDVFIVHPSTPADKTTEPVCITPEASWVMLLQRRVRESSGVATGKLYLLWLWLGRWLSTVVHRAHSQARLHIFVLWFHAVVSVSAGWQAGSGFVCRYLQVM